MPFVMGRLRAGTTALAGEILYRAIRATIDSADLRSMGRDAVLAARAAGRPLVFVGWHGHDFVNIGVYHPLFGFDSRALLMVPETLGAEVLTEAARRMKIEVVSIAGAGGAAPSGRGLVSVIKRIQEGHDALLAVDGPSGPARQAKPGAAFIAQRAKAVIVPTAIAASPSVRLAYRWDDHVVPLPGGRIDVHFGPLIDTAPPGGEAPAIEDIQRSIDDALTTGTARAEQANGADG